MSRPTCQWGDCDQPASHRVYYTSPIEQVAYCEDCLPAVRQHLDYQRVDAL